MKTRLLTVASILFTAAVASPLWAQGEPAAQGGAAPAALDLRALLTPVQSEMAIVTARYNADRTLIDRFYNVTVAPMHIARLKRFDMDWLDALGKLDAAKLTPAAQTDLQTLKGTIQRNLQELETETAANAQVTPLLPFAPGIIRLEEARRRMDSIDAEKAGGDVSEIIKQIGEARAKLVEALGDPSKLAALNLTRSQVLHTADAVDQATGAAPADDGNAGPPARGGRGGAGRGGAGGATPADGAPAGGRGFGRGGGGRFQVVRSLRNDMREWFNFYNDYDPLFTWWLATPYKDFDNAIRDYASLLRDKVAPAVKDEAPNITVTQIPPSESPKFAEVPDLQALLSFPQNEMRGVLGRFQQDRRAARNPEFYRNWLAALKQLDFDKLSRNAQVDYLHLRNSLEVQVARLTTPPEQNIPRKNDDSGLPGNPIGRVAMQMDLKDEVITYSPEQLLTIADKEYAWCESEAKKASREMGFGDDWKKAIEVCKQHHVPPGKQPDMIRDLMREDVDFLRAHDLVTVPEVDQETLRMIMMSLQRQQVNPFFTGGTEISVSYPLMEMTQQQKLESMRGNNWDFARATVHHELIPGHNLQGFTSARFRGSRGGDMGSTPFYGEGWAVYWEMMFYDMGFAHNPEEHLGFLYWRMMRCARIHFSLNFHLGNWSPGQCVDCLVNEADSERENAIAEVRRAFNGSYGPLYQAGYLLGALQFRELRKELVDTHQLTEKQFHDAVLEQASMPVELVRLALTKNKLSADMPLDWRFYPGIE